MKTLSISEGFPLVMRPYAPTLRSQIGGGAVQLRRQWQRPYYEFTIPLKLGDRADAEDLAGFIAYHQGDIAFWYDGGPYGDIQNPVLIGIGDGALKDFYVPFRNLTTATWHFYVDGTEDTNVTLNLDSGLVSFTSAPASTKDVTAKGQCKFKCVFWGEQQLTAIAHAPGVYSAELILREIP